MRVRFSVVPCSLILEGEKCLKQRTYNVTEWLALQGQNLISHDGRNSSLHSSG